MMEEKFEKLVGCRLTSKSLIERVKLITGVDVISHNICEKDNCIFGMDNKMDIAIDEDTAIEVFFLYDNAGHYYITEIGGTF